MCRPAAGPPPPRQIARLNRLCCPLYGTNSGTVTSFGGIVASVGVFMCIPPELDHVTKQFPHEISDAKVIDLEPFVRTILSQPKNEIIVNFPVRMDNGERRTVQRRDGRKFQVGDRVAMRSGELELMVPR